MNSTTIELLRAALKTDPTVSPADRARVLAQLRHAPDVAKAVPPVAAPAIWTRKRVAAAFGGRSLRLVDRLAQEGVLTKVTLPGRKRATGFRAADVEALISVSASPAGTAERPRRVRTADHAAGLVAAGRIAV